jgi:hypothetical protein
MPHDHPRTESQRAENARGESARAERSRGEHAAAAVGEAGIESVNTGLRLQNEMVDLFQDIAREWFERATSKAELAFVLPNRLTAARSIPDAISAYQLWLGEWMNVLSEDRLSLLSGSQRIMDTSVRCFGAAAAPAAR